MQASEYTPGGVAGSLTKKKQKTSHAEDSQKIESMFAKSFPVKIAEPVESPPDAAQPESKKRKKKKTLPSDDGQKEQNTREAEDDGSDTESPKKRPRRVTDPESNKRTVFIGNVSTEVSKKKLIGLFKKFGKVESSRFRSGASANPKLSKKAAIIKKEFHPSKPCLNAYVVYTDAACVEEALSLNGHVLEGRHLRVDRVLANKSEIQHGHSVFVGNVPLDAEEEDLRSHFESCGDVANVRIVRDPSTGLGKGFAFILFSDKSSVSFALKLHQEEFDGRKLRVMKSTERADRGSDPPSNKLGKARTDRSDRFREIKKLKKSKKSEESQKSEDNVDKRKFKNSESREAHKDKKLQRKKKLKRRLVGKQKKKVANILSGKQKVKRK